MSWWAWQQQIAGVGGLAYLFKVRRSSSGSRRLGLSGEGVAQPRRPLLASAYPSPQAPRAGRRRVRVHRGGGAGERERQP